MAGDRKNHEVDMVIMSAGQSGDHSSLIRTE
jgi:hypothetical protein